MGWTRKPDRVPDRDISLSLFPFPCFSVSCSSSRKRPQVLPDRKIMLAGTYIQIWSVSWKKKVRPPSVENNTQHRSCVRRQGHVYTICIHSALRSSISSYWLAKQSRILLLWYWNSTRALINVFPFFDDADATRVYQSVYKKEEKKKKSERGELFVFRIHNAESRITFHRRISNVRRQTMRRLYIFN